MRAGLPYFIGRNVDSSGMTKYDFHMRRTLAIAVLCFMSCALLAQAGSGSPVWKPLRIFTSDALPHGTIPKVMVGGFRFLDLKVVLEETKLGDVQARLGGEIGHEGDAGDSLSWLCYGGKDSNGAWVLWLKSGEMDAGTVGAFQWRRVNSGAEFDKRCQILPEKNTGIKLPVALSIGSSEAKLLEVLGNPTIRKGNKLLYVHEHDLVIRQQPCTLMNTVEV